MSGALGRCPNQAQAREFLATLDVDEIYLDAAYDRCFCERCYLASFADTTGNEQGSTCRGSRRFLTPLTASADPLRGSLYKLP